MEALMPEPLSKAMNALTPNMMPSLIPFITPRMIARIRTEL